MQYVFSDGKMNIERLRQLVELVGKQKLVLDLSCRKKVCYVIQYTFFVQKYIQVHYVCYYYFFMLYLVLKLSLNGNNVKL
jgi:hypothetical protein